MSFVSIIDVQLLLPTFYRLFQEEINNVPIGTFAIGKFSLFYYSTCQWR